MSADYPPNMTLRPLASWPHAETTDRRRSPFKAGWSDTMYLLRRELWHLGSGYVAPSVLQIALREQDFRKTDGMPRASSVPSMPGVILTIESRHGPLSYPCDRFDRWQDNLRAIALGLEALRKIDRYGITPGSEQYTGWKALPSPASTTVRFTAEQAETFLRDIAGAEGHGLDLGTLPQVLRRAKANTHPDRNDGDASRWHLVEQASKVLEAAGALG
jgi:hypothetical protein